MDKDQFSEFINIFIQARNCQEALHILKILRANGQWDKEDRKRYPIQDPDKWYDYIKNNIDKCIDLIEGNLKESLPQKDVLDGS